MKQMIFLIIAVILGIAATVLAFILIVPEKRRESQGAFCKFLHDLCNFKFLVLRNIVFVNLQLIKRHNSASAVIRQPLSAVILYGVRILTPRCFKRFIGVIAKHCVTGNCPVAVTFIMLI